MAALILQISSIPWGKLLLGMWALSFAGIVGPVGLAFFTDETELQGNLAFGILVAAVFINAANLLSYKIQTDSLRISKVCWIGLNIGSLLLTISLGYFLNQEFNGGTGLFLTYAMLILSFPLGILWSVILSLASHVLVEAQAGITIPVVLVWAGFFCTGYFQWYKLVPYLISKRSSCKKSVSSVG